MDISWNNYITTVTTCILLSSIHSVEMMDSFYLNGRGLEQNTKWKVERIQKLNIIKTEILKKMGLVDRPPQSLSSTNPPVNKTDTLDKAIPIENDGDYIDEVQEVISLSEPAANIRNDNILQFRIAQDSQGGEMEIDRANVLVKLKYRQPRNRKKRKQKKKKPRKIRLILSTVTDAGVQKDVISSLKAEVVKTNWFKLAIPQKLVEDTLKSREPVLKLHIKCKGCKKGAKLVLVHGSKMKRKRKKKCKQKRRRHKKRRVRLSKTRKRLSKTRPFLLLHTRTKTFIRPKRDLAESCPSDKNALCCQSPFLFRFSDVGWDDWIISPPSFRTAFCLGRCALTKECVETDHSDLRIIYFNQSGAIIVSSIPNVIVTNCGCRR